MNLAMSLGRAIVFIPAAVWLICAGCATSSERANPPTLFIIGDSTVKNGTKGQMGWGERVAEFFDTNRIHVANHAIGGRSSRTFLTEGRWERVLAQLKPGDFVIIQFGHNDGGAPDDRQRPRGSLRGTGEETREIEIAFRSR